MDPSELSRLHREHVDQLQRSAGKALEAAGYGAVALHSGSPQLRTRFDDRFWPLQPSPCFQHWLPLAEPGCVLVVSAGKQPLLLRSRETSFWEAVAPPETDHFWGPFEVRDIARTQSAKEHLPAGRVAFVGDDVAAAAALGFAKEDINPQPLLDGLDRLRVLKTPYEIACISEANRRAAPGHDMLRAMFAQLDHAELELHLAYLAATAQDDAETPYKNIVALGPHAATLHHVSYGKKPDAAQSLLLDAGASFAGYCSDITRTWVKGGGAAATAFAQLVAAVESLQQRLCASVRTGLPYEELHDQAHRFVADALREAGISRLSSDELVSSGITRAFFPHGLGHSLGLVCHDVGCGLTPPRADNPWLRNTSIIAPRQVFTIEPGIYFIPALLGPVRSGPLAANIDWTLVDALGQLGGIRIEDDVVVEPNGIRNLTRERLPTGGGTVIRRKAPR